MLSKWVLFIDIQLFFNRLNELYNIADVVKNQHTFIEIQNLGIVVSETVIVPNEIEGFQNWDWWFQDSDSSFNLFDVKRQSLPVPHSWSSHSLNLTIKSSKIHRSSCMLLHVQYNRYQQVGTMYQRYSILLLLLSS